MGLPRRKKPIKFYRTMREKKNSKKKKGFFV